MMTLERYSHVMHLTSQVSGRLRRRAVGRSTCCGPRCRPAPCRARRRCGPWRSSTSSSRPSGARTPAWSATSTSPATSTPPSPSARSWSADDGRASVQAGAGIVADSVPEHEDLECHNKARALLAAIPAARRMTARRRAHAGGSAVARWIASAPWPMASTCGPPWERRRSSATSSRVDGPEAIDVPPGPAQPGRRRRWRVGAVGAVAPPPADRARSTPGCGSPASPTTPSLLDVDAGLRRGRARPARALQAAHQGRPRRSSRGRAWPCAGPGAEAVDVPRGALSARPAGPGVEGVDLLVERRARARRRAARRLRGATRRCASSAACPAMGAELTDATIPAEAGQWLIDASVSFTKGCYTGQELVARIDSRGGNVPRPLRGLARRRRARRPRAPTVRHGDVEVGTRDLGSARSAVLGAVALAPLARSVEVGAAGRAARRPTGQWPPPTVGRPAAAVNDRAAA